MELIGSKPISGLLVSSSNTPEVRLLSSTSITRLLQYYEPVRHPTRPSLLLTEFSLRRDRALLYLVALRTGLRRGELQSLTTRSFDFSVSPPTVTVEAAKSKHRSTDILPLSAEIAALLQPYLLARSSDAPVRPGSWWRQASKMLARDLTEAGISGVDAHGRVIDFHALRTTFITGLARAGVMPAMAQRLARHSDINLTLGVYTQLELGDLAEAVGRLPTLTFDDVIQSPCLFAVLQTRASS